MGKTKMRLSVSIIIFLVIVAFLPAQVLGKRTETKTGKLKCEYDVRPAKVQPMQVDGELPNPLPFNLDMVDTEQVSWLTGEGIYVAVLDTGLLSNYRYFFPEGIVNIREDWGKGFTHDIFYVGTGGNWSDDGKFSYGPIRSDRGFITHDDGNPLTVTAPNSTEFQFGWGSGHGTHVTSIITGWYLNREGIEYWVRGVAPKVTIIPVLVLDDWVAFDPEGEGYFFSGGSDEMVAAGIQYVGDLARIFKVKIVINMSLGGSTPATIIENAINYAVANGVIIVASAGNEGAAGMGWPGAYPQVISAAAAGWTQEYWGYYLPSPNPWYWWEGDVPECLRTLDPLENRYQVYLTDFSSRPNATLGQKSSYLDIAAPGAAVKGPYKSYGPDQWGYYSVWGTSQAAPHVTAIAALVLQDTPKLNQMQMERIIKYAGAYESKIDSRLQYTSAWVFDIFSQEFVQYTWNYQDFGTGFLQADNALLIARAIYPYPRAR